MEFRLKINPAPGLCRVWGCRKACRKGGTLCGVHNMRKAVANNPVKYYYIRAKLHAKQRGIPFDLTEEQYRTFVEATGYLNAVGITRLCFHLDRIDHTQGYTITNLQILTCGENSSKGNRERFLNEETRRRMHPDLFNNQEIDCPF